MRWADEDFERQQLATAPTKMGHPHFAPLNQAAIDALRVLKRRAGESPRVTVNADT